MSVPTIAGAMPPPVSPKTAGALGEEVPVQRVERRARRPSRRGCTSTATASSAASDRHDLGSAVDPQPAPRAPGRLERDRSSALSGRPFDWPVEAVHDPLRDDVRRRSVITSRISAEVEQRRRRSMFVRRALVAARELARERVAAARRARAWSGCRVLPITCVTAIASPSARPRPSVIAATTPPFTYGTTTPRTISQRVAPSPSEASFTSRGHAHEELAADRRGDRDDHDRQHDDRRRARPPAAACRRRAGSSRSSRAGTARRGSA